MDWFDPDVLNRIAQRMGTVDALLKSPLLQGAKGAMGGAATPDNRDVEGQMRRCVHVWDGWSATPDNRDVEGQMHRYEVHVWWCCWVCRHVHMLKVEKKAARAAR